jgi:subtilisin family serine protease
MNARKLKCWGCLLVFLLSALLTFAPAAGGGEVSKYVPGEALVVLKNNTGQKLSALSFSPDGAGQSRAQSVASAVQASAVQTYAALSRAADAILVHVKSDSKTTEELIADLKRNPDVLSAAPNYYNRLARTPDDARYGELWGLQKIRADKAWDTTTGSRSITVAVIDSGVDSSHPDLIRNLDLERAKSFVTEGLADTQGHGTHVIGTIGAVGDNAIGVTGVNWEVNLLPLKVFQADGASDSAVAKALEYLTELQETENVRVYAVNLSLGSWVATTPDQMKDYFMYRAYKALDATDKTVIVVAAGNEGQEVGVPAEKDVPESNIKKGNYEYPASFIGLNNMIVVGAIDQDGKGAVFSSWSPTVVDLLAPGVGILSTMPNDLYKIMQGTSMAAPCVAGAVGLLAARKPALTASELKSLLLDNANGTINPPPYNRPDVSRMSRNGLLDIKAALDKVSVVPVPVESISVAPSAAALTAGESAQFTARVLPSTATDKKVKWSSDKPSVAEVNAETGLARGVGVGSAVITAQAQDGSGVSGSATVVVSGVHVPVMDVSISPGTATLLLGKQQQFTATVYPLDASDRTVAWSSDEPLVAEIDEKTGLMYAVGVGNAVITVTTREGGFSETAQVTVTPPPDGGGGGCSAGWGLAALAAVLLAALRKARPSLGKR